jgi:hypothetical protein
MQRKTEEIGFDSRQGNLIFFYSQMSPTELWSPSSLLHKRHRGNLSWENLPLHKGTYLYLVQRLLTRGFTPPIPRMPEFYGDKLSIEITLFLRNFPDDNVCM